MQTKHDVNSMRLTQPLKGVPNLMRTIAQLGPYYCSVGAVIFGPNQFAIGPFYFDTLFTALGRPLIRTNLLFILLFYICPTIFCFILQFLVYFCSACTFWKQAYMLQCSYQLCWLCKFGFFCVCLFPLAYHFGRGE